MAQQDDTPQPIIKQTYFPFRYEVDEISPEARVFEEGYDYVIMSKMTKFGKQQKAKEEALEALEENNQGIKEPITSWWR